MFSIYDGRTAFYQYDLNRKLIIDDKTIKMVHFCNRTGNRSLVRYAYEVNGLWLVDVPNIILQESYRINVYGYDNEYTKYSASFNVIARSMPEDYVYTDAEITQWEALEERIAAIEENGVSQEKINGAVEEYLNQHPIQSGATEEEKAQIAANTQDITAIKEDYASKLYVAAAISDLKLEQYALKTEIPSLEGYATEAYVNEAVANVNIDAVLINYYTKEETDNAINAAKPDLTGYATQSWVEGKGYLTQHQDLSKYALKTEIPSLDGYAKTTDIPDVSGYQTAEQVNAAINTAIAAITNGEEVSY